MPYRRKKLTFAISSPDEFLLNDCVLRTSSMLKREAIKSDWKAFENSTVSLFGCCTCYAVLFLCI